MQRVVSRAELLSDGNASSPEPEAVLKDHHHEIPQFEYIATAAHIHGHAVEEDAEDLAFNLFAPAKPVVPGEEQLAAPQKIRLRSPSIDRSAAGFLGTGRDPSYYFTSALSPEAQADVASSALSGEQILAKSYSFRPDSAYDWKVLHIPSSQQSQDVVTSAPLLFRKLLGDAGTKKRRTRPGKKYRIKLRTKRAALLSKQEAAKAAAEAKEAAEREKKTRKNREKKAKKRMRDKAKLAAEGAGTGAAEVDGEVDESEEGT